MTGAALFPLMLAVVVPKLAVMTPALGDLAGDAPATGASTLHDAELAGARSVSSVRVVAPADLERLVARAADVGIRCDPRGADCAARIGAFGGLDFALVTAIDAGGVAALTLVDCADGRALRTVRAPLAADRSTWPVALHALARAALGAATPPDAVVPPAPPASAPFSAATAAAAVETAPRVGVGVLVVGVLVAAAAGLGAWAIAPTPETRARTTARQYNDAVNAGRALVVVSGTGLAVAGAGAAVFLLLDDPAP